MAKQWHIRRHWGNSTSGDKGRRRNSIKQWKRLLKKYLQSSKPVIKAVAPGTAEGGSIRGLIASKLTDSVIPDDGKTETIKDETNEEDYKKNKSKKTANPKQRPTHEC